jgi:hypothetical protein
MQDTGTSQPYMYEELLRVEMSVSVVQNSELKHMKNVTSWLQIYNLKQSLHCILVCIGRQVLPNVYSDAH